MSHTLKLYDFEILDIERTIKGSPDIQVLSDDIKEYSSLAYKKTLNGFLIVYTEENKIISGSNVIKITTDSLINFFSKQFYIDTYDALNESLKYANKQLFYYTKRNDLFRNKKLNCLVLLIREKQIYYAYVGITSLYIKSKEGTWRVTPDIVKTDTENYKESRSSLNSIDITDKIPVVICENPILPSRGDMLCVVSNSAAKGKGNKNIIDIIDEKSTINDKGVKIVKLLKSMEEKPNVAFILVNFLLTGGKYSEFNSFNFRFGYIIRRIINLITSTAALLILLGIVILLIYVKYGM